MWLDVPKPAPTVGGIALIAHSTLLMASKTHRFLELLLFIFFAGTFGCARSAEPLTRPSGTIVVAAPMDRQSIQRDLMNLVDDLITSVADVYGEVIAKSPVPRAITYAESQRLEIAFGALDNAVNSNPLAGLIDTVVLVTLARASAETEATREILGDQYETVMIMLRSQEASAWRVASRYLTTHQIPELHRAIEDWRTNNPEQRYISHVRLVDFVVARSLDDPAVNRGGSIFSILFLDPLAGIDPAVREISHSRDIAERMFFYGQRTPLIWSWRAEKFYRQMLLVPQITKMQDDLANLNQTSRRFTDITSQFAASFDRLPWDSARVVDQLTRSIALTSDATVQQATTRLASEREAAINQFAASIRVQQEETMHNLEAAMTRSIERFHEKLQRIAVVTVIVFFTAMIFYRLLFRIIPQRKLVEQQVRERPKNLIEANDVPL